MGIFDDVVTIENNQVFYNNWIEWEHLGILLPTKPVWYRTFIQGMLSFFGHCGNCTALSGCYFVERIMPEQPQHERCHCAKKTISFEKVKSDVMVDCPIEKFTNYIFAQGEQSKGKNQIFESMGFTKANSFELKLIYENQARQKYLNGNYQLGNLDIYGQRINIQINLKGQYFLSGWMLEPKGKLRNTTPFGGWIK